MLFPIMCASGTQGRWIRDVPHCRYPIYVDGQPCGLEEVFVLLCVPLGPKVGGRMAETAGFLHRIFRMTPAAEKLHYLLRCDQCHRQEWYVVNLAERGFKCDEPFSRYCSGYLVHVGTWKSECDPKYGASYFY